MIFSTEPARLFDLSSGVFFVALGVWILTIRPRRPASTALAAFSMALGGAFVASNTFALGTIQHQVAMWWSTALSGVAAVALIALALLSPQPPRRHEARIVVTAALAVAALATVAFLASDGWVVAGPLEIARAILLPAFWFVLVLLPLRCRLATDRTTRSSLALMAAALVLYPGVYAGARMVYGSAGGQVAMGLPGMAVVLVTAVLWLTNTHHPGSGRAARNAALVPLAAALFGMTSALFVGESLDGPQGAARTASVLLIAYAILKHQLFGIDVRVRWGISKSTLAGVFIAVFFIASETAQEFFGETLGSQYVGILAAGALVFAIAPLSRVADRLAEKAVPLTSPATKGSGGRASTYKRQVELAWADGRLGRKERVMLRELRDALGLDAATADALERDAENEKRRR